MRDPYIWADEEIAPLLSGDVMNLDERHMSVEEAVAAYAFMQALEKKIEKRKAVLRDRVMQEAESQGRRTEKGGQLLMVENTKVVREKRMTKTPPEAGLREILAREGLDMKSVFSERTTYVLDPSKLQMLLDRGKLEAQEIEELKKVSYALKVEASSELTAMIDEAGSLWEPPEGAPAPPKPKASRRTKRARYEGQRK